MTGKSSKLRTGREAIHAISEAERAVIGKCLLRHESTAPVRFKVAKNGKERNLELDHPNPVVGHALRMNAFGSADPEFCAGMLGQLMKANQTAEGVDEGGLNFMVSIVNGMQPRDQVEAMLAAQMAAVHVSAMNFAHRLERANTSYEQDSSERAFTKLTRTFTTQMEALKRYRSRGEQKVTNVSVSDGGQAIVGDVTRAARENLQDKATTLTPATNVVPLTGAEGGSVEREERAVAAGGRR